MISAKHQIWFLPFIGVVIGGAAEALGADHQASLSTIGIGILSGLARYLQYALPDTGTQGVFIQKKKEIGQPKPLE